MLVGCRYEIPPRAGMPHIKEDGEYLVLLPQDAFVLFLAADLLVIVQLPRHLLCHSRLSLHRDLVNEK